MISEGFKTCHRIIATYKVYPNNGQEYQNRMRL